MKKLISLFLFMVLFSFVCEAQTADDFTLVNESESSYHRLYLGSDYSLTSASTKYSKEFIISNNDGGYSVEHPWTFQYDLSDDSTKISVYWLTNSVHPDSTNAWVVIDTLVSGSTTATPVAGVTSAGGKAGLWNKIGFANDTTATFTVNEFSIYTGAVDK